VLKRRTVVDYFEQGRAREAATKTRLRKNPKRGKKEEMLGGKALLTDLGGEFAVRSIGTKKEGDLKRAY